MIMELHTILLLFVSIPSRGYERIVDVARLDTVQQVQEEDTGAQG